MSNIVDIGSAKLNNQTGMVTAQCKGTERSDGSAEDFGEVNLAFGLGFAAVPAPADENGNAQCILLDDVAGQDGVCVGGVDARTTKSYAELGPGETVMFASGGGYDARVFCKDQLVAIMVGKDCTIVVDRKAKKIAIASNSGAYCELSEDNGAILTGGGSASIQAKGDVLALTGTIVLGGRIPMQPIMMGTAPTPGGVAIPTPGVFYGK